jgi:hypothetical protein
VIVALHVASGAAIGAAAGSRGRAAALGLLSHLAGDVVPHDDLPHGFEAASGVAAFLLLAAARGPLDPATVGAAAASAPDLEHVLRRPGSRARKLFPSHRYGPLHQANGLPGGVQLVVAGAVLGALLRRRPVRS